METCKEHAEVRDYGASAGVSVSAGKGVFQQGQALPSRIHHTDNRLHSRQTFTHGKLSFTFLEDV